MQILRSHKSLKQWRDTINPKKSIGLVPTMGALHEGHLSLVRKSKRQNAITIVSIFVNPRQFGPQEDFKKYPRNIKRDIRILMNQKIDAVYIPSVKDIYPKGFKVLKASRKLTQNLCGNPHSRGPQHFDGVVTVVAILFDHIKPHKAYFGLKDYQQVRVIEKMINDMKFKTKIIKCPTLRESDGLAKSSRNAYFSLAERRQAPKLYMALQYGRKLLSSKNKMTLKTVLNRVTTRLTSIPHTRIDYIEFVDPKTLKMRHSKQRPILLAAAVTFGKTRLIDNLLI